MNLDETAKECRRIATEKGFYGNVADPHFHRLCAFLTSEVGELWEAVRKNKSKDEVAEEIADIIILALSVAAHLDIKIDSAVVNKIEKNKHRLPLHGKSF